MAMTLPAIGVGAAGGMAAMSGASANTQGGFLGFLLEYGPLILLVSVALVTIGLALRRPRAAVSLTLGFAAWAAIYRWTLSGQQSTGESAPGR